MAGSEGSELVVEEEAGLEDLGATVITLINFLVLEVVLELDLVPVVPVASLNNRPVLANRRCNNSK